MYSFLVVHILRLFIWLLKASADVIIFQLMLKLVLLYFRAHMRLLRAVDFLITIENQHPLASTYEH